MIRVGPALYEESCILFVKKIPALWRGRRLTKTWSHVKHEWVSPKVPGMEPPEYVVKIRPECSADASGQAVLLYLSKVEGEELMAELARRNPGAAAPQGAG